jgi:hypothetical protein
LPATQLRSGAAFLQFGDIRRHDGSLTFVCRDALPSKLRSVNARLIERLKAYLHRINTSSSAMLG